MSRKDSTHYLTADEYVRVTDAIHRYVRIVLVSFGKHSAQEKDLIIRNFIARGTTCLQSILQLWSMGNYQDCWILHRSLIDRLFHLRALWDQNDFVIFEKWSFARQFEAKNRILSDPEMRKKLKRDALQFSLSPTEKRRYTVIKRENANWSRPKAERIAKKMNLPFLYALGYDYASTHVHPMANDGEDDFLRITRTARRSTADQITVLHNSVVILLLLIQTGLNASDLHWRAVLYDFLDHCILLLERGSREYTTTLAKIENAGLDFPWCQMPSASRDGA